MVERREVLLADGVEFLNSEYFMVAADEGIDGGAVERALIVALVHYVVQYSYKSVCRESHHSIKNQKNRTGMAR